MNYLSYRDTNTDTGKYNIILLVPSIEKTNIEKYYISYLESLGLDRKDILIIDLKYSETKKKTPVKELKDYIDNELISIIENTEATIIGICDGDYFKVISKKSTIEPNLGYILPAEYIDKELSCLYIPNFKQAYYNPVKTEENIKLSLDALNNHLTNKYIPLGTNIINKAEYPKTYREIREALNKLLKLNVPLTCDIETFDLKFNKAGLGSITFCWNDSEGISFLIDYEPRLIIDDEDNIYGDQIYNLPIRELLRDFFIKFKNTLIFHNASFDLTVLVYTLFMRSPLDQVGLLNGLEILTKNFDDTMIITYLMTNSTSGNTLGLKDQSHEFTGNYAQENIKDIRLISPSDLLEYNLKDGLATWYVYNKYYPSLLNDTQYTLYKSLLVPAIKDIIQMQLSGLPLDMNRTLEVSKELKDIEDTCLSNLLNNTLIKEFIELEKQDWVINKNKTLKRKTVDLNDAEEQGITFNPNSNIQLSKLLYNHLHLPILNTTSSGSPSTDGKTIIDLQNHTDSKDILDILVNLKAYKDVNKINTAFIPAFLNSMQKEDGNYYLHGNFKLGGTLSGRLSSNSINLQQLPATGSAYAKPIKSCFKAPKGWLFVTVDFNALEAMISALTTKDKNKLKVYEEGYDSHCLNTYYYWKDQFPDINPDDPESINSIKDLRKDLRTKSKPVTFAATYGGTAFTFVNNSGFTQEEADKIYKAFHELYSTSDEWVNERLTEAANKGYAELAFGLKLRCPLLEKFKTKINLIGLNNIPNIAKEEARTVGNALGQSWGLLNTRASIDFMNRVRNSTYKYDIKLLAHIHKYIVDVKLIELLES